MKLLIMAFVLACKVAVGNYQFRQVNEVRIEKSWRELANKATIKLPRHVTTPDLQTKTLEEFIHVGDKVSVTLYYLGLPEHVEFEGYVRRIKPNTPFEIECEDEAFLFRKVSLKKNWKGTTLKEILQYTLSQVKAKYPDTVLNVSKDIPQVNFKQFLLDNVNALSALEKLKDDYGLTAYFRNKELFVGLAYTESPGTVKYSFAWNIIEHDLTFKDEDDFNVKVKAIGIKKNNKRVTVEVGDPDGDQRTIYKYNVTDEAQLRKLANEELQKMKYSGFEGNITTFLYPYAEPLMTADMIDPQYNNSRTGKYVIDSVITEFGENGARREVEIGIKVSANV